MKTKIGTINSYYGFLYVKKEDGYFWGIENWDGIYWERIPKELYDNLVSFEKKRSIQKVN